MTSLYVDRRGTEIRVDGGALVFYDASGRLGTVPLAPLTRVILRGNVQLSASVLGKLGEHGIGVIVLSGRKGLPALFMGRPHNDASRRLAQYRQVDNPIFCLHFARQLVHDKLLSQHRMLADMLVRRPALRRVLLARGNQLQALLDGRMTEITSLDALRGIEGAGANLYFSALAEAVSPSLNFTGRNRRPPRDPFNAMLSLGYTLLHAEAVLALHASGFDPYIGFYHALAFGRESLASDIIEPVRAEVDAFVLRLFAEQVLRAEDFSQTDGACLLGKAGRLRFYQHYDAQGNLLRKALAGRIEVLGKQLLGDDFQCPDALQQPEADDGELPDLL
ncbi:MAG: CRISPR-associated endonuclease Cas1 [Alcanivoracaceae bacterium]